MHTNDKRGNSESVVDDKPLTRLQANRKIMGILSSYIETYPDMRFGQVLYNLGVATHKVNSITETKVPISDENPEGISTRVQYRDIFFIESEDILKQMQND